LLIYDYYALGVSKQISVPLAGVKRVLLNAADYGIKYLLKPKSISLTVDLILLP